MSTPYSRPSYDRTDTHNAHEEPSKNTTTTYLQKAEDLEGPPSSASSPKHAFPEIIGVDGSERPFGGRVDAVDEVDNSKKGWFAYFKTRNFWIILCLGQMLSLCDTGTNIFSEYLADEGTSIPAFQNMLNYILLMLVYGSWTVYKYGIKGWAQMVYRDGWRYLIYSFMDVQGNYFTVLAYRYVSTYICKYTSRGLMTALISTSCTQTKSALHR